MLRLRLAAAALLSLVVSASTADQNNSLDDESWCGEQPVCGLNDDDGPWMSTLQQWALSTPEHGDRQGRIMALPPAQGYYVSDRAEGALLSPPPAPHKHANHPARPYDEWQHAPPLPPTTGKIVNRPPNPYKDKFKPSPSYPAPVHNQPIPVHSHAVDRVDENRQPPQKQVSETDLYLLGAIEKLVWRADLFEKRLRKLEENVHLMVAGVETKDEPCAENFTRVGAGCYHVSADAANWKGASYGCRRLHSNMLEIDSDKEKDQLAASIFSNKKYKDPNTNRGFILINPGGSSYNHGSEPHTNGKVPKMCSLVKCAWVFRQIRNAVYLIIGTIAFALLRFVLNRIVPNIILTVRFAKASLKVANTVQLSPLFPMRKMNKNKGDFWTGGLNPGLLWIWSHSARPVAGSGNSSSTGDSGASGASGDSGALVAGAGRCLAWVSDPLRGRAYRGQDCALRLRYICEKEEDSTKLSNEIERVARNVREGRKPNIVWTDHEP